jgi:hypothetical protein
MARTGLRRRVRTATEAAALSLGQSVNAHDTPLIGLNDVTVHDLKPTALGAPVSPAREKTPLAWSIHASGRVWVRIGDGSRPAAVSLLGASATV